MSLEPVVILIAVLAIVTVVGHGIWSMLAAMFGGGSNRSEESCPRCRSRLFAGRCLVCNWPAAAMPQKKTAESLAAMREQVQRYAALGLMEKAACERIVEALEAERQRLAAPAAVAADKVETGTPPLTSCAAPYERAAHEVSGLDASAGVPVSAPANAPPSEPAKQPLDADSELRLAPDPPPLSIEERARQFVERQAATVSQAAEPNEESPVAVPPVALPPPRRPVFDLLSAFLEEQNIRWGELIGGLLIVGCSIALVISFWAKIAERPFLKFVVFNGVTAALFGLGLYAAHRWKLRTTSRAMLLISILLVPLNFLAIAAFTESGMSLFTFSAMGEAMSVALFAGLCAAAARIVTPRSVWLLVVGVIAPSLVELIVRRWVDPATDLSLLLALGTIPTAVYAAVNIVGLWQQRLAADDGTEDATNRASETLALLTATAFAALLPLGLLVYKTGRIESTVHQLAVLISAGGMTPLAVGLFLWKRLTDKSQITLRTTGLSVAVVGMLLLIAGVVLAWPEPAALLPTALLVAVVLSAVAIGVRLPDVHCAAAVCLTLAYLTGWHLAAGRLNWRGQDANQALHAFVSGSSGQALVPLVALYFGAAALLGRVLHRSRDARAMSISGAGVAAISTGLISWFGFGVSGDPLHATWIYAAYGVATCVATTWLSRQWAAWKWVLWIGAGLTLAACVQGVVYLAAARWPLALPWASALALEATVMAVAAAACRFWRARLDSHAAGRGFGEAALAASIAALALIAAGSGEWPHPVSAAPLALHWLWLAAVWLGLALLDVWPLQLFAAFRFALALAVWFGVAIWLETRQWFLTAEWRWLDPWTLQAEGIALATFCLAWIGLRRLLRGRRWAALVNSAWPADAVVLRLVLVALLGLSCYAAWPGVAQELSPREMATTSLVTPGSPPIGSFEILHIPHAHAQGWGSWLLLAAVVAALAAESAAFGKWNRTANILLAMMLDTFAACPLAASRWEADLAVASAIRWYAVFYLIAATVATFAWQALLSARHGGSEEDGLIKANKGAAFAGEERALLFFLGGAPALAGALFAMVGMVFGGRPLLGPDPLSLFGRIGLATSYAGPVALLALTLVAYAIRERSSLFALAGGLMGNLAATIAYVLRLADRGLPLDTAAWIGLAQLNAIVAALYVLAWIGCKLLYGRRRAAFASRAASPMWVQISLAAACNLAVLAPAWWTLVSDPLSGPLFANQLPRVGGVWGWSAAALTIVAIVATGRVDRSRLGSGFLAVLLACAATLLACTACRWDTGNWLGFHVLLIAHAAAAWLLACIGRYRHADERRTLAEPVAHEEGLSVAGHGNESHGDSWRLDDVTRWTLAALAVAVWLSLRSLSGVPKLPWLTIGVLASQALLAALLACWSFRPGLLYVAMPLINLGASVWWIDVGGPVAWRWDFWNLANVNIAALAIPAVAWLALDVWRFRPHRNSLAATTIHGSRRAPHHLAASVSLTVLALMVGINCAALFRWSEGVSAPEWVALGATAAIWIAMLWDGEAQGAVAGLYFVGLVAAGVVLDQIRPETKWLWWTGDIILAAYALVTSLLWSQRAGLWRLADRLRMPYAAPRSSDAPTAGPPWLVVVNCALVWIVVALSYGFVLTYDDRAFRLVAAKAVLVQMLTLGLLARGDRRSQLRYASLMLGVLGAVAIGWAGLQPAAGTLLNRTVVAAAALAIAAVVYGLGLTKLLAAGSDWLRAARRLAPVLVAFDIIAVLLVLAVEILQVVDGGRVSMDSWAIAAMTAVLIGLCAAALAAAVLPGRDPLGLSERGRQAYVYGAEALLTLVFVHVRLCVPQWFHGILAQYWPLVVQGIAFVGVAIGELLRRRRWTVVGEPLTNTGALLPLLPVIGYWILPARVDFSLLLLAVGLLYGALSVMRRSFGFGLLAVLAANGSLWYFLAGQEGYRLFDHPQLWMIPPALCVLVAAHLNRRQLTAAQMTAIRYGVSIVIYVSSTADIFLQGVARAPWLPLVLAGLSLGGVLLGIVLRVRAFLILGTSFLLLSLMTIIWYAAVDLQQTWLWYAAGIVVGVLILVVFAVFEKQHQAVTNLLDHLKKWQP